MAEFKRAFGGGSEGENILGLDNTTLTALGDLANGFWPVMLGTLILMVLILRGEHGSVIPLLGGVMLLQAWQSGVFG